MGYTHYWYRKKEIPQDRFDIIYHNFYTAYLKLQGDKKSILGNGAGEEATLPEITSQNIIFNGRGDDAHETVYFPRVLTRKDMNSVKPEKGFYLDCTKTARKPYDFYVMVFLIIAKFFLQDDIKISSDGSHEPETWQPAIDWMVKNFGYGMDFKRSHHHYWV